MSVGVSFPTQVFCNKALARLRVEDRGLPQIKRLQAMLRRGIGIHHAGDLKPVSPASCVLVIAHKRRSSGVSRHPAR